MTKSMLILGAYLHALGMATYVGGSFVMEFVLGPAQKLIPPAQAQVVSQKSADRFLLVVWGALGSVLAGGLLRLFAMRNAGILVSRNLYASGYGRSLLVMVSGWCLLVINGLILTFVLRPKLSGKMSAAVSAQQAQSRQQTMMQAAKWAGRIVRTDLVIAVLIVFIGASIRGGGIL